MNIKHKKAFGKEIGGGLQRQHASPRANGNDRKDRSVGNSGRIPTCLSPVYLFPPFPLVMCGTQDWSHLATLSS